MKTNSRDVKAHEVECLRDTMTETSGDSFEVRNEQIKSQCGGCESLVLFYNFPLTYRIDCLP